MVNRRLVVLASVVLASLLVGCGSSDGVRHIIDAPPGDGSSSVATPDFIWYVLDEASGSTAKDSSANHYDITNLTGVTWSQGAHFDGTGGGGSVAVDASYRTPPITISAWLTATSRADETTGDGALAPFPSNAFGDDIPAEFGYGIGLDVWTDGTPGQALIVEDLGACIPGATFPVNCAIAGNVTFVASTEYLITLVIDADLSTTVYVNGAQFASGTAGVLQVDATQFWLGQHNDDTTYGTQRFFAGSMRDIRVYKSALTATEAVALYTAGPTTTAP
jgi:hypothetical protein